MDTTLIVIIALLFLAERFLLWKMFAQKQEGNDEAESTGLKLILQQMNELSRTVDSKVGSSTRRWIARCPNRSDNRIRFIASLASRQTD